MSGLLTAYANMLEGSVRTPERFPWPRPTPEEADHRMRVVALPRALTRDEGEALLRGQQFPERLAALADAVGLPKEECAQVLSGVAWKLSEGLRPIREPGRQDGGQGTTAKRATD
jgi:hypothetical protein